MKNNEKGMALLFAIITISSICLIAYFARFNYEENILTKAERLNSFWQSQIYNKICLVWSKHLIQISPLFNFEDILKNKNNEILFENGSCSIVMIQNLNANQFKISIKAQSNYEKGQTFFSKTYDEVI